MISCTAVCRQAQPPSSPAESPPQSRDCSPSASLPPRSTTALPVLRQIAATSLVTFGRDSYTTPTTPSGTRRFEIARPFGRDDSVELLRRPDRRAVPRPRHRAPSRRRARASGAGDRSRFAARHVAQSCAFAARISLSRARIALAIAPSAAILHARLTPARARSTRPSPRRPSRRARPLVDHPVITASPRYSDGSLRRRSGTRESVVISADRHPLMRSRSAAL